MHKSASGGTSPRAVLGVVALLIGLLVGCSGLPSDASTGTSGGTPTPTERGLISAGTPTATTAASASGTPRATASAVVGQRVTVFAAASLQNAFKELGTLFQRKTGAQVDFNFGASNTLQTQIEQGAQVDVFASASLNEVQALSRQGLLEGDPSVFARNRLVIAVPRDNPARISTLHDLARPGVKFVTAQPGVPVGRYTVQMLDLASRDPAYGADFKQRVEANTVSREDNVRAVLGKVALGEADAGVVYATDAATDRDHVTTVPIPDTVNVIAEYPIARLKAAPQPDLAQQFVTLVLSDEGQEVLAKYGFAPAHS